MLVTVFLYCHPSPNINKKAATIAYCGGFFLFNATTFLSEYYYIGSGNVQGLDFIRFIFDAKNQIFPILHFYFPIWLGLLY